MAGLARLRRLRILARRSVFGFYVRRNRPAWLLRFGSTFHFLHHFFIIGQHGARSAPSSSDGSVGSRLARAASRQEMQSEKLGFSPSKRMITRLVSRAYTSMPDFLAIVIGTIVVVHPPKALPLSGVEASDQFC
jgi:hypothetical protein